LAPGFRQEIGYESDNRSDNSFWDFAGDEHRAALDAAWGSPAEDDSDKDADDESGSVGSSGYESM
jgi:methylmalonyl-CoA mutase N-terminal domain/subunit